ncbi:MAG: hypothetical protein HN794_05380 [Euryarchaeota archaeon]|jgi:hypothetical protein|nr:hypothetical protein [Euryarchaeota archaeon]MBT7460456.1 hypothetical protein [Euryarchaeota archaeon]
MGEDIEWRVFALTGIICVVQTFFDLAPEGPWDSRSFTRGVIGLIGIGCLYISWFRFTFNQKGVIPIIKIWKKPGSSWLPVMIFGIMCYVFVISINELEMDKYFPKTTGMILLLMGSLSILNATYVWLVVNGPLSEKEVLEQE